LSGIYIFIRNTYRKIVPKSIRAIIWKPKNVVTSIPKYLLYFFIDFIKFTKIAGIYSDTIKIRADLSKYYNFNEPLPEDYKKTVIYMADGRVPVGGLSDRLRAIVSVYKLCKELNLAFKINFTSPFSLNEYLLPNIYAWTILPDEICYNKKQVKPCFIFTFPDRLHDQTAQAYWAKYFLNENYKQIHIYTNANIAEKEYAALFKELFRPAPELENLIDYNVRTLGEGGSFISVAFRFEQLLGDFKEPDWPQKKLVNHHPVLPDNEKEFLINKCMNHLEEIYSENDCRKVLVTSDSVSFLEKAKRLPFVYVIPGDVRHIDAVQNTDRGADMKVFLDYFVLSRSKKVYLVMEGKMYRSGFSYRAALLNNVPFIVKDYSKE
jgi:hypothetical protein